jgi:hypothetical protein
MAKAYQPFPMRMEKGQWKKGCFTFLPPPLCFLPLRVAIHIAVGLDGVRAPQQLVKAFCFHFVVLFGLHCFLLGFVLEEAVAV